MPELPEVQTVVSSLAPTIVGRRIRAVRVGRADIIVPTGTAIEPLLRSREIQSISRRGKRIVFELDNGNRFYIHLGMSGRLMLESAGSVLAPHTHLVFEFDGDGARTELRFRDPRRFGGLWWLGHASADDRMGPEPLTIRSAELFERLSKTRRSIKAALLDQTLIAGLGNIYVDEALFEAGIHPMKKSNRVTREQVERLTRAIKSTLKRALRHKGSTLRDYVDADGNAGRFQRLHRVYDRTGDPCAKCKSPIQRTIVGGRSTHFCAKCQSKSARR